MQTDRYKEFKRANKLFQAGRYNDAAGVYSNLLAEAEDSISERSKLNLSLARKRANPGNPRKRPTRYIQQYSDFPGMMRRLFVNPVINAPFDEEDRRGLAFMDVLARSWEASALAKLQETSVAVLMPTYNRVGTLPMAIDSVLGQSHSNLQLIIIDDASTDATPSVLAQYAAADSRIRIFTNESNLGKAASLNRVIPEIGTDWVAYLDSDNRWHSNYLASMLGAATEQPAPEAVFSGQYLYKDSDTVPAAVRVATYNKNLLLNRNYIDHNSFMHRTSVFDRVGGYDSSLRKCIDFDFILKTAVNHTMASVPVVLTDYFYSTAGDTLTADRSSISDMHKVLADAQSHLLDPQWATKERERSPWAITDIPPRPMSVIIPSYESLDDLKSCVAAVNDLDEREHIELIIVDNKSGHDVTTWLRENAAPLNFTVHLLANNFGFTHAVNEGIRIASPERDIILMNNDAQPLNGSLSLMSAYSQSLPDAGLLVPAQVLPPATPTINVHVPFARPEAYTDVNVSLRHDNISPVPEVNTGDVYEVDFAPFFCVYIPRKTIEEIGPLSADLGRHYRSDRLYSNAVRHIAKQKIYYISGSRVLHGLQGSTKILRRNGDNPTAFRIMFVKNRWEPQLQEELGFSDRPWMLDLDD